MKRSLLIATLVTLLLSGAARAQDAATAKEFADLKARLSMIEDRLDKLESKVESNEVTVSKLNNEVLSPLVTSVETLRKRVEHLDNWARDYSMTLSEKVLPGIDRRLDTMDDRFKDIAETDGNRSTLKIFGNMQASEKFREEFAKASQGAVMVSNTTGVDQRLTINGTAWRIPAGGPWKIMVPMGIVTTHLAPFESPRQWQVSEWKLNNDAFELAVTIGY